MIFLTDTVLTMVFLTDLPKFYEHISRAPRGCFTLFNLEGIKMLDFLGSDKLLNISVKSSKVFNL